MLLWLVPFTLLVPLALLSCGKRVSEDLGEGADSATSGQVDSGAVESRDVDPRQGAGRRGLPDSAPCERLRVRRLGHIDERHGPERPRRGLHERFVSGLHGACWAGARGAAVDRTTSVASGRGYRSQPGIATDLSGQSPHGERARQRVVREVHTARMVLRTAAGAFDVRGSDSVQPGDTPDRLAGLRSVQRAQRRLISGAAADRQSGRGRGRASAPYSEGTGARWQSSLSPGTHAKRTHASPCTHRFVDSGHLLDRLRRASLGVHAVQRRARERLRPHGTAHRDPAGRHGAGRGPRRSGKCHCDQYALPEPGSLLDGAPVVPGARGAARRRRELLPDRRRQAERRAVPALPRGGEEEEHDRLRPPRRRRGAPRGRVRHVRGRQSEGERRRNDERRRGGLHDGVRRHDRGAHLGGRRNVHGARREEGSGDAGRAAHRRAGPLQVRREEVQLGARGALGGRAVVSSSSGSAPRRGSPAAEVSLAGDELGGRDRGAVDVGRVDDLESRERTPGSGASP